MENVQFNLNYTVKVKLSDAGVEHYVRKHNEIMPFQYHISFKEYKDGSDVNGYHSYQMHDFMDNFGNLGLNLANMCNLNILIPKSELQGGA